MEDIKSSEIPDCLGIIGGPPCLSWSEANALQSTYDPRGMLAYEYMRIIKEKRPKFFLFESVSGILHEGNKKLFKSIKAGFEKLGYVVSHALMDARDYEVPQNRERVFMVGFLGGPEFKIPPQTKHISLKEAI